MSAQPKTEAQNWRAGGQFERAHMSITTLPLIDIGSAAASVVAKLAAQRDGIDVLRPSSRDEWLAGKMKTVGASEAPALLSIHPYLTPFELFNRKAGNLEAEQSAPQIGEDTICLPPLQRGTFLEERGIELARMLRPDWSIVSNEIPGGRVFVDREIGMSCTPDAFATLPSGETATLQIKSVEPMIFRNTWKQDGGVEPPLWIALQALQDATLAGADRAFVGAMVIGFNIDFHLIEVPMHTAAMAKVRVAVKDFWRRIAEGDAYPPDYAKDGAIISALYAQDDGSEADLSGNNRISEILWTREALKAREKEGDAAAKERKAIDAEIISALGNATRGRLADGRIIEAKTIRRGGYEVAPTSYRTVKVKG
jgi:hypothetical protein